MKKYLFLFLYLSAILLVSCNNDGAVKVTGLQCEMLNNPQGIDVENPRLNWKIESSEDNVMQNSYHILVSSTIEKLNKNEGDLWDSGDVNSDASIQIPYAGKPLQSRMECYWKVKVTTSRGASKWSKPASWTMGLMNETDWQAKWTGLDQSFEWDAPKAHYTRLSARYFRKEFNSRNPVKKATVYLSGLGLYKMYINGNLIGGDQELSPTATDYTKSVKYNTFDVSKEIKKGENALGVILGNGRFYAMRYRENYYPPGRHWLYNNKHFGFPKMILQLEIEYENGEKETIVSDDSWKVTADGPIRANNEFDGEEYDATKEMPGWNKTGFDDDKWQQAELVDAPEGKLEAQLNSNIKVMETLKPVEIKENKPGVYIMDMGQNMVGWLKMKVKGNKGDQVKLRFSETLLPDGALYMDNIREAQVTDLYTLKGTGEETWEPMFIYHGFRYVEISGFPGKPELSNFEGKVLYDEMETTGSFETSDKTINQIYHNAYWGIRGNYRSMPTDCPQRDERMGWLGDRVTGALGESFIFNNNNLYAKWLDDIEQAQLEDGTIPDVAPNYWDAYNDNMTWPAAYITIADMLYKQFGNKEPIERHYPSMKKWLAHMTDKYMVDYIMTRDTYGDWCLPPESPEIIFSEDPARRTNGQLIGTAFYYRIALLMEKFARLLGYDDDVAYYAQQAANVKRAFNSKFLNKETGQYDNNTVTANLTSLFFGLVPDEYKNEVFKNVVDKTVNDFNSHVSVGVIGIQSIMRGLTDYGAADLALKIATNRDYPSWGYMIENGATTIWELWNGNTADPAMNSGNHVMLLGDVVTWFYEYLAGIRNDPANVGFKEIVMKPYPVEGLDYVKASYRSVHGMIKSSWTKKDNIFEWEITIPANTTATVYLPVESKDSISADKLNFVKMEGNYAVYIAGSGKYKLKSTI